jgi:Pentapeptide repeats (8 copies)
MRRFPRLRRLVVGFALIGLFTAVLAGAASDASGAVDTSESLPVFMPPPPAPGKIADVVANNDANNPDTYTPPAYENEPNGYRPPLEPAFVNCSFPLGVTLAVSCTAKDTTDPTAATTNGFTSQFSLRVADEPTKLSTPGFPWPTKNADASDTATVTYMNAAGTASSPVTAAEGALNVYHEINEATPNCDSPFAPPITSPSPPPGGGAISGNNFVSSGTFPLGDTLLACNASDGKDSTPQNGANAQTSYFHVIVTDPPATLTVPPTQLARATSSSGATVIYAPGPVTAVENGEADTPICSVDKVSVPLTLPDGSSDGFVSGGTFPVGGTTVTCGAPVNDDPTNPGPQQSFSVIVTNTPCAALAGCNLHGLDLSNAILAGADLSSGTDLSYANLNKADLSGADLSFANLSGANLNRVDLTGANLTGAITTGANFNRVTWSNTTCPDGTNSSASTPGTCLGHW